MSPKPFLALVLLASLAACNKKPAPAPPSAADMPPPAAPQFKQPDQPMDTPVMAVFNGTNAHAMAGLGHELETKRPPLTLNVLQQMLVTLRKAPDQNEQVNKMRALLFRSAAVIIGRPALPFLSDCLATIKELSQLCGGALQEIEKLPNK
jgi:hypothetical protein